MKILFVTADLPSRIRVRPFELIRVLSERGHTLKIATLARSSDDAEAKRQLQSWGVDVKCVSLNWFRRLRNVARAMSLQLPLQYMYSFQPRLWEWIAAELDSGEYDLVHVEHLRGAVFGARIRRRFPGGPPVVWDAVDAISWLLHQTREHASSGLVRIVAGMEYERTRRCEGWLLEQFDAVTVTAREDRARLQEATGRTPVEVVPNGVDAAFFSASSEKRALSTTVVFSGKMSYHANVSAAVHFILQVLPILWETHPEAHFLIVGARPPRSLVRLARRVGRGRITVTGTVPDLRDHLRSSAVAVAPMPYGVGVQNKVLEALSCGTPVVAYPTAVRALTAVNGRDLLVAESAREFAVCVGELLEDPGRRRELGAAGRDYVLSHHSWTRSGRKLEEVYEWVLGRDRCARS